MSNNAYPQHLNRLKEEQERALAETGGQLRQWQTFRSDYKALKERLTTLPDQLTHDVMVPFSKMAFMPGQLVHTNEILVLLGDDWFVDRSAKQAADIVDRRISSIDSQIEDLNEQMRLLEPRRDFTSELHSMAHSAEGGMQDIREEYDEEKERQWKESHKKRVRAHRQSQKKETDGDKKPLEDEQLWDRLDQLERIETERGEMQKLRAESWEPVSAQSVSEASRTGTSQDDSADSDQASDENTLDSDDEEEETDDGEGEEEVVAAKGKVIHFAHSKQDPDPLLSPGADDSSSKGMILSPADLFSTFRPPSKPSSILKKSQSPPKKTTNRKKSRKPVVSFDTGSSDENFNPQSMDPQRLSRVTAPAFSGTVREKTLTPAVVEAPTNQTTPSKPISKFKAATNEKRDNISQQINSNTIGHSEATEQSTKPVSRFKSQRKRIT